MERKLAVKLRVESFEPMEGSDNIHVARFSDCGWRAIVRKEDFNIGDVGVFFEYDAIIPRKFITGDNDETKIPVKARKIRSYVSDGLLLPLSVFKDYDISSVDLNESIAGLLGVTKIQDKQDTQEDGGWAHGVLGLRKTFATRWQNFHKSFFEGSFSITEKLDGTSCTITFKPNADGDFDFEVYGRNYKAYEFTEVSQRTTMYAAGFDVARMVKEVLKERAYDEPIALQGEIIGEGIGKNRYNLKGTCFYCFCIVTGGTSFLGKSMVRLANILGVKHVPFVGYANFNTADSYCRIELENGSYNELTPLSEKARIYASIEEIERNKAHDCGLEFLPSEGLVLTNENQRVKILF